MIPLYLSNAALRMLESPPLPATESVSEGSTERDSSPEVNSEGRGHRYVRDDSSCSSGVTLKASETEKAQEMKKSAKSSSHLGVHRNMVMLCLCLVFCVVCVSERKRGVEKYREGGNWVCCFLCFWKRSSAYVAMKGG